VRLAVGDPVQRAAEVLARRGPFKWSRDLGAKPIAEMLRLGMLRETITARARAAAGLAHVDQLVDEVGAEP
jgi:hypothetical protein